MNKTTGIIIGVIAVAFLGLVIWSVTSKMTKSIDYSKYDYNSIIEPDENNGNIGDHVKGSKDAKVLIFEYADFQCPGCASINPKINKLIDDYKGKLAVVYRSYILSYHQNGKAAAAAAEAAGLQGYWKEYGDFLFANQADWENASTNDRAGVFTQYFEKVTNNKGDTEKFKKDMNSDTVAKKITFDNAIGEKVDVQGTPALYLNGNLIKWTDHSSNETEFYEYMHSVIDPELNK